MIEWKELKWDSYKENPIKRFKKSGKPVNGKVRKKGMDYVNDILILNYKEGKEHGPFRIEHDDRAEYKLTKGTFSEGKIDGPIKKYYDDGKTLHSKGEAEIIRFAMPNENDEQEDRLEFNFTGKVEYYNEKGILHLIVFNSRKNGKYVKKFESYYSNGQLKATYTLISDDLEGEKKEFYEDGTLKKDCEYKNDELDGYYKDYHKNGSLKSEGIYKNGYKDGKWLYYYENGVRKREEMYDTTDYYFDTSTIGVPNAFRENKEGRVHGTWRYYDEEGNCVKEENYKNDYKHGITTEYHSDGTTTKFRYVEGRYKGKENKFSNFLRNLIGD